jgi:4,5-DOPA dioxygenase extradiol
MDRMPTLFLSHGSPMHAIEPGKAAPAWYALAQRLPRPRAILVASAHWETDRPMLTSSSAPETVYDYYGFPPALYQVLYPAPGAPEIATRALQLLTDAGYAAILDATRGLDHGTWVPLRFAYPNADIPVLQVSLQTALGTRHHLALGQALAPLCAEGVLIVGSGHVTHNLRDFVRTRGEIPIVAYAREFQSWLFERLAARDDEAILDYRQRAPHAARAHPSEEHFLPLFVALGAAGKDARSERVYAEIMGGALAMDAYAFGLH